MVLKHLPVEMVKQQYEEQLFVYLCPSHFTL